MVLIGVLKGKRLGGSGGRKSVGMTERMKRLTWCYPDSVEEEEGKDECEEKRGKEKGRGRKVSRCRSTGKTNGLAGQI